MGFMDKAKKLAEQAQQKLDEAQTQFNQSASPQSQPGGDAAQYDQHGRPVRRPEPAAPAGEGSEDPDAPLPDPADPTGTTPPAPGAPTPDPSDPAGGSAAPDAPAAPAAEERPRSAEPPPAPAGGANPNPDPFKPLG